MNKSINLFVVLLGLLLSSVSCSEDDNTVGVSAEWKRYQQSVYNRVMMMEDESNNRVFEMYSSLSGMGDIYVKNSDFIANNDKGKFDKDAPIIFSETTDTGSAKATISSANLDRSNIDTDSVRVRYEGWFYMEGDKKVIFDSTERSVSSGQWLNNINEDGVDFIIGGVVDGFKTLLQKMKVGEEKIVCMPYQLGYGESGGSSIPGYTTLFFNVKLLKNITAEEELKNKN